MSDLASFTRRRDFLICVDSDGCAMDTMDVKHEKAFCPELIRTFGLAAYAQEVTSLWMEINLFSKTRGINRFKGMIKTFEILESRGIHIEGLDEMEAWVRGAKELSNPNLKAQVNQTGSAVLQKVLDWSLAVNRAIAALPKNDKPFEGVLEGLAAMRVVADIAVVSSANSGAIETEWTRHGLAQHVDVMLGQEAGTKAYCIGALKAKGYIDTHILMLGDALGDLDAAERNGVLFYPILIGREAFSWQRLIEEALPKLLHGSYVGEYQRKVIQEQRQILK